VNRGYFKGVYTVVPTPLHEDESIDHKGLQHLINYYIDSGCHGLVMLGSGGEFPYFSATERIQIMKTAAKAAKGRIPVLAGSGFCSLSETAAYIGEAGKLDIDGFLVILPTYHPVDFNDALLFYSHVASISGKPVFYYHYPQMTELFYTPRQLARLFALKGIAGIKESSLNLREVREHLAAVKGKDFVVFSGNSFSLLSVLAMGGAGTICQIPSFAPRLVVDCYNAWKAGDKKKAEAQQRKILDLMPFLNTFGLPAGVQKNAYKLISRMPFSLKNRNRSRHAVIKETLRQMGHPVTARVRNPLPQITRREQETITQLLSMHKLS